MDSRLGFTALVAVVALLRLAELAVSRRHIETLRQRGGIEVGAEHYPWMVAVHVGFLIGGPLEVWLLDRPWLPALGVPMLAVLAAGSALRYWTIHTLGERWSTRVIVVPGAPLEEGGPYRWLRHPNYVGVVLELAALPLVHTAWITALLATVANSLVLRRRIGLEDSFLR